MRNILHDYLTDLHDFQRIAIAIAKGGVAREAREIDLTQPSTWEFSGFSQNGEDGIIDILKSALREPNRYFLEIGSADGVQNNTTWLLVSQQYHGVMVEGDPAKSAKARRLLAGCGIGVRFESRFVTRENAEELLQLCAHAQPDLFSLDIDGNDYYIAQALLNARLRPKIVIVEYNSIFGPQRSVTIPYSPDFDYRKANPTRLYYGVSLGAWQKLFGAAGYRFVTVERNGVNAIFADPAQFRSGFLDAVKALNYAENTYQVSASGKRGEEQFALIRGLELVEV